MEVKDHRVVEIEEGERENKERERQERERIGKGRSTCLDTQRAGAEVKKFALEGRRKDGDASSVVFRRSRSELGASAKPWFYGNLLFL